MYETNFNGHNFYNKFAQHDLFYGAIIKGFRTKPGKNGKNYFCELGADLIAKRQIVVSQTHDKEGMCAIGQLKSFGKVGGHYMGMNMHDDIAVTVVFASQFFKDDDFEIWIEEWFDSMANYKFDDPLIYNKYKNAMFLQRKYVEQLEDDITDKQFNEVFLSAASGFNSMQYGQNSSNGGYSNQMLPSSYNSPVQ